MIHQKTFDTLEEIRSYSPDLAGDGDVAFIYIDNDILGHVSCGMFRLLSGFAASGKVDDSIFILESFALADFYWKRIHKGLPVVDSTGTVEVLDGGTVTLTHYSDPNHIRNVTVKEVSYNDFTAVLGKSDMLGAFYAQINPADRNWAIDTLSDPAYVTLAKLVEVVLYQAMPAPGGSLNWSNMIRNDMGGLVVGQVSYDGQTRLAFLREAGGVYSFEYRTYLVEGLPGLNYLVGPYTFFNGDRAMSPGAAEHQVISPFIANYNSGTDRWDGTHELFDEDENSPDRFQAGSGGLMMDANNDVYASIDRPPYEQWDYYWPNPETWATFQGPSYNKSSENFMLYKEYKGKTLEWPFATSSMMTLVSHPSYGALVRFVNPDFSESHLTETVVMVTTGVGDDGRVVVLPSWQTFQVYSFTKTGDVADIPHVGKTSGGFTAPVNFGVRPTGAPVHQQRSTVICGDYFFDPTVDSCNKIVNNMLRKTGDFTYPVEMYDPNTDDPVYMYYYPVGNDRFLAIDIYNERASIVTFQENAIYVSAYLKKSYSNFMSDVESINSILIVSTDVGNGICRFLFMDEAGLLYRWNGSNWVVGTYATGNTKTEFEGSNLNNAITDIGRNLGFCVVFETDGIDTPKLGNVTVEYSRPGDGKVSSSQLGIGNALYEVKIVSDTQTSVKNVSGSTKLLNVKSFIFDE